jgi:hypothetical protein
VNRNSDLMQIVYAVAAPRRLPRRLDGRQKERHEDADDSNDDQQLDKGKTTKAKWLCERAKGRGLWALSRKTNATQVKQLYHGKTTQDVDVIAGNARAGVC